ncbi:MAG: DUF1801 domain-containing protein [Paracoccaceae bacterium]|nr:MAG: DUF1801 domain-containing protein [Paracoccaceae bacterium]
MKPATIDAYNSLQAAGDRPVCDLLRHHIDAGLPGADSRIWHAHPVWFLAGNPIVGYSRLKAGIRLMFWSGADFDEPRLRPGTGKFKDASILYTTADQVDAADLARWLAKAARIQWNYRDLMRRGRLERIA